MMSDNITNDLKFIKTNSTPQYYAAFIANNGNTNFHDENVSVISDITDNTKDVNSTEQATINLLFETTIQKYTIDELKSKCKENGIKSTGLKKQELIQCLIYSFTNIWTDLKKLNVTDLRTVYKTNDITEKFASGNTKEIVINNIMNYNSKCSNLLFVKNIKLLNVDDNSSIVPKKISSKCKKNIICDSTTSVSSGEENEEASKDVLCFKINELKKQYERLEYEERIKQEKLNEEIKIKKEKLEYEERIKQEKLDEEKRIKKQSEKSKKQFIPKNVKINVWNTHIDINIQKHKCLCCKKSIITNTDFDVGHVISEKDGGTHEINNLRPICSSCNHSMGTTNMIEYIVKYGYYIS
jgi:5-methylcytosine-specific restriction endonuclease McrA